MLKDFFNWLCPRSVYIDVGADDGARVNVFVGSNIGSDVINSDDDVTYDDDDVDVAVDVDVDKDQTAHGGGDND